MSSDIEIYRFLNKICAPLYFSYRTADGFVKWPLSFLSNYLITTYDAIDNKKGRYCLVPNGLIFWQLHSRLFTNICQVLFYYLKSIPSFSVMLLSSQSSLMFCSKVWWMKCQSAKCALPHWLLLLSPLKIRNFMMIHYHEKKTDFELHTY